MPNEVNKLAAAYQDEGLWAVLKEKASQAAKEQGVFTSSLGWISTNADQLNQASTVYHYTGPTEPTTPVPFPNNAVPTAWYMDATMQVITPPIGKTLKWKTAVKEYTAKPDGPPVVSLIDSYDIQWEWNDKRGVLNWEALLKGGCDLAWPVQLSGSYNYGAGPITMYSKKAIIRQCALDLMAQAMKERYGAGQLHPYVPEVQVLPEWMWNEDE